MVTESSLLSNYKYPEPLLQGYFFFLFTSFHLYSKHPFWKKNRIHLHAFKDGRVKVNIGMRCEKITISFPPLALSCIIPGIAEDKAKHIGGAEGTKIGKNGPHL